MLAAMKLPVCVFKCSFNGATEDNSMRKIVLRPWQENYEHSMSDLFKTKSVEAGQGQHFIISSLAHKSRKKFSG